MIDMLAQAASTDTPWWVPPLAILALIAFAILMVVVVGKTMG